MTESNRIYAECEHQGLWITPAMQEFSKFLGLRSDLTLKISKSDPFYFEAPPSNLCGSVEVVGPYGSIGCAGSNGFVTPIGGVEEKYEMLKICFVTDKNWTVKMIPFINLLKITHGYGGKKYDICCYNPIVEYRYVKYGLFRKPEFTKFKEAILSIYPEYSDEMIAVYPKHKNLHEDCYNADFIREEILTEENKSRALYTFDKSVNVTTEKVNVCISLFSIDLIPNKDLLLAILSTFS